MAQARRPWEAKGIASHALQGVDFSVRAGEIVGLAGVEGNGQRDFLRTLAGLQPASGTMVVAGRSIRLSNPVAALEGGIVYLPGDRHAEGLFLPLTVRENMTALVLDSLATLGLVQRRRETSLVEKQIKGLSVKTPSAETPIKSLSGGNQQKVVMARALATDPRVLVLIDPTAGVDVKSKEALLAMAERARDEGRAVIVSSGELDDLRGCDRVLVMFRGRIVQAFAAGWADHELIASIEGVDLNEA